MNSVLVSVQTSKTVPGRFLLTFKDKLYAETFARNLMCYKPEHECLGRMLLDGEQLTLVGLVTYVRGSFALPEFFFNAVIIMHGRLLVTESDDDEFEPTQLVPCTQDSFCSDQESSSLFFGD